MRHQDNRRFDACQGHVRTLRQQEELPLLRDHLLRLDRGEPPRPLPWLHGRQLHRALCRKMRRRRHRHHRLSRRRRGARRGRTASAGSIPGRAAGDRFQRGSLRAAAGRRQHPVQEADRGSARQGLSAPADHHRRAERGDAGARQQVRRASDLPPRRIHRHHRSDKQQPQPELATACDRDAGRCRARDDRISTARTGRCCCGCMAGAGRPDDGA